MTFTKEPSEERDLGHDWSDWLFDIDGNPITIATSTWTTPAGITTLASDFTGPRTRIRIAGGTWGDTYELFNTVTANNGEVETRSLLVRIQRSVAYCTPIEVRRRMMGGSGSGGTATTTALPAAELESLIEQASRMFDLECNVPEGYFNPSPIPIAQDRTFYGDGTNYLRIDPYVAGTLDTSITVPDGYTAPSFVEKDGYLVVSSSTGLLPPFPSFYNSWWSGWWSGVGITVSAIWGFRETPADVKMAVIELVINLVRETDPATLKLTDLEGQPLREKLPPRVAEIARRYRPNVGAAFA